MKTDPINIINFLESFNIAFIKNTVTIDTVLKALDMKVESIKNKKPFIDQAIIVSCLERLSSSPSSN